MRYLNVIGIGLGNDLIMDVGKIVDIVGVEIDIGLFIDIMEHMEYCFVDFYRGMCDRWYRIFERESGKLFLYEDNSGRFFKWMYYNLWLTDRIDVESRKMILDISRMVMDEMRMRTKVASMNLERNYGNF